jgi:uncharacterized protein GlcG (DUF336 family)
MGIHPPIRTCFGRKRPGSFACGNGTLASAIGVSGATAVHDGIAAEAGANAAQ